MRGRLFDRVTIAYRALLKALHRNDKRRISYWKGQWTRRKTLFWREHRRIEQEERRLRRVFWDNHSI